jgi:hypothetical protein
LPGLFRQGILSISAITERPHKISVEDAIGMKLAHDIIEIRKGEFKGRAFKKGHIICHEDVCYFHRLGKQHVYANAEEKDHLH